MDSTIDQATLTYTATELADPCQDCSAPCCRYIVIPHPTPVRWMDLDFIRYVLGFPGTEAMISEDGRWSLLITSTCRKLDTATSRCLVHGTPEQPRTCVYFNPHHCWYKRNFFHEPPVDFMRLDLERFEQMLTLLQFDQNGEMVHWPGWKVVKARMDGPLPDSQEPNHAVEQAEQETDVLE